jgi:hypothetical protein
VESIAGREDGPRAAWCAAEKDVLMPIESRFDDLDLREEPARPDGASAKEQLYASSPYKCPTTTVQHTFDCFV